MKGEGGEGDTLRLRETRPNWVIKARARTHGGPVVDRPTLAVQYPSGFNEPSLQSQTPLSSSAARKQCP